MYERLREIRKQKGITVQKMCKLLGKTVESAYYKKETGAVTITLQEAIIIAKFFGMPIEEIFLKTDCLDKTN